MASIPQPNTPEHSAVMQNYIFSSSVAHSIANGVESVTLPGQALVCTMHGLRAAAELSEAEKAKILSYHAREEGGADLPDVLMWHNAAAGKTLVKEV